MIAVSSPQARPRFDKGRATLSLLLLSAAVLGSLALRQSGRLPVDARGPGPSVWTGTALPQEAGPPAGQAR